MRIVQANPFYFPRLGGIERRMHHVARELAMRGHESIILTGHDGPGRVEEETDGVRIVRLPSKRLPIAWDPPVTRTPGVRAELERLRPDIIDFHYRWAPEWARAVERAGAPWVFTWHNQYGEGSGLLRPISLLNDRGYKRRVQRGARLIVCVSDHIRRELERHGFAASGLRVVLNGAQRPVAGGPEWQPDDGRPVPGTPYAVAVGRLTPEKGNDLVLDAFAQAVRQGADMRLVLCGRGPEGPRLRRQAERLGIAPRVTFGGWVPEAAKWRLLEGATAMLHMARFESYGIAIAEAIVAGTPVVAADVGGVREVVGDAGVLVPAGDTVAAGTALAGLVSDEPRRKALAQRAAAAAPGMAWPQVARRMQDLYAEALRT